MKHAFTSWSFWFGICQIAFGAVGYFSGMMSHAEALGLLGTGATTVGLRFKTTQPITL